ncbi:MAG: sulfotransferase [bacterium]|nr:sulfotransferase [bacterium]
MQRAVREGAEKIEVVFRRERVLAEAEKRTGLSDFGSPDFEERLDLWLESLDADETLSGVGRVGAYRDCVRYASARLRMEDFVTRNPDVLDLEIERPIIVVGLPRSGTTHLLNLIAADRRLRSMPYWESLEPVPARGEADTRRQRCIEGHEMQSRLMPLLKNMHDMAPDHVHEEIELQGPDFSTYTIEWIATIPRWRDYYYAHDQRPHYAYLKRALQILQFQRGPNRWILKSPQHLEQLGPLIDTFPDATVAFTHRDPVSVIASAITMICYGDRIRCKRVDPEATAAYWIDRIEHLLRRCVLDRELVPESQSLDILFDEFMQDDLATVDRIYQLADLEKTPASEAQLRAYMEANPRGKHGRIAYDLKADFGVDPGELRERFAFYYERFPVRVEG